MHERTGMQAGRRPGRMNDLLEGLAPIFAIIALGWALRVSGAVKGEMWGGVNRLAFVALIPAYSFVEIARADFGGGAFTLVGAGFAAFSVMGVLAFALLPLAGRDGPGFASAYQGSVRWNAFVVLAMGATMIGAQATALTALLMGFVIPLVNVLSIIVFSRWGNGQKASFAGIVQSVAFNPMIIACALGLATHLVDWRPEGATGKTLDILRGGALGLSLLSAGAGLDLGALNAKPLLLWASVLLKVMIGPVVFLSIGLALGVHGVGLAVLALMGSCPSPPASYILAREMGGDARLMAGHITASTFLSLISMPIALAIAQALG
jgi:malonate transporter and related proteins